MRRSPPSAASIKTSTRRSAEIGSSAARPRSSSNRCARRLSAAPTRFSTTACAPKASPERANPHSPRRPMAEACTSGIDTGFVALGYAKVAVLGVVQGITELMPISSTAHMRIVPALLGWRDPGSAFSAAMQLAALAAVIAYFWRDVRDILIGSGSALARRDFSDHELRLAIGIVIGTIPIGLAGLALAKTLNICGSPMRGLWV